MHLVVILGPLAVGKTTVAYEIGTRTGYTVFHNHMTVEPLAELFGFGTPSYERLTLAWRSMIISESVAIGTPGMIMTFAMNFDDPSDATFLARLVTPVLASGGTVDHVELRADQQTRLAREGTEIRLSHKRSKRDVDQARRLLLEVDDRARFTSGGDFPLPGRHLMIDNTDVSAGRAAEMIIDTFGLPRS